MPCEIKAGLHWWTAATAAPEDLVVETFDREFGQAEPPGGFGHPFRRHHASGMVMFCGSPRPDQPLVLNASGEVCESWADVLVARTRALGGWVTRADLAVDVYPPELARTRLLQLRRDYRAGAVETTMRRSSLVFVHDDADTGGETVYFGGKLSALRFRAYDQRGPLRIEAQWRPERRGVGEALPGMLEREGVLPVWRGLAEGWLKFKRDWFCEILSGQAVDLGAPVREESSLVDTMAHLKRQWGATLRALDDMGLLQLVLGEIGPETKGVALYKFLRWANELDHWEQKEDDQGRAVSVPWPPRGGRLRAKVKAIRQAQERGDET